MRCTRAARYVPIARQSCHDADMAADDAIIDLLRVRDGELTEVRLTDGRRLLVLNIAWGYDDGDEFAHVTTNISPSVDGAAVDVFSTRDVTAVLDDASGMLFRTSE